MFWAIAFSVIYTMCGAGAAVIWADNAAMFLFVFLCWPMVMTNFICKSATTYLGEKYL